MSEKWNGFTQEEISNISNEKGLLKKDSNHPIASVKGNPPKHNNFGKKSITREQILRLTNRGEFGINGLQTEWMQGARLFIPQIPEENEVPLSCGDKTINTILSTEICGTSKVINTVEHVNKDHPMSHVHEISLENFEKKQNFIKEQNRQKKEILKKALEDRTKKTHEEAQRLTQIEEELKKLDFQLSNDVSILRNQIEFASLEFMEAQKRFDRAEREYLDAKLSLFTKKEHKELLTGHLCTIIEQNELRKAKKLSDLMDKLHLGSVIIEKPMEKIPASIAVNSSEEKNNFVEKNTSLE